MKNVALCTSTMDEPSSKVVALPDDHPLMEFVNKRWIYIDQDHGPADRKAHVAFWDAYEKAEEIDLPATVDWIIFVMVY